MNLGFIGTGNIAKTVANTLKKLNSKDIVLYACASRSKLKADKFAEKHGFSVAYGSYEDVFNDKTVDLIYIATPHSTHYSLAKRAILSKKNVIVEKPIATDMKKLSDLIYLAKENGVFLTEAFWTAFDPIVIELKKRTDSGEFGKIISVDSSFRQPISHVKRVKDPALAGGALLDLGVYDLFHSLYFSDSDVRSLNASAKMLKTKVDATTKVKILFENHFASFECSIRRFGKNDVTINTENAVIKLNSVNFPTKCTIRYKNNAETEIIRQKIITGYEFEFIAARKYIESGRTEAEEMPHSLSLKILSCCDEIRNQIGLIYPFD